MPVLVEDADVVVREIVRIGLHLGDQILADDRGRHRPERVEVDLDGLGAASPATGGRSCRRRRRGGSRPGRFRPSRPAAAGMLASRSASPRLPEKARRRTRLISSWRRRTSAGTFSACTVCCGDDAGRLMPWRAWKRFTPASTYESNTGEMPAVWSRSPVTISRWRSATTAWHLRAELQRSGWERRSNRRARRDPDIAGWRCSVAAIVCCERIGVDVRCTGASGSRVVFLNPLGLTRRTVPAVPSPPWHSSRTPALLRKAGEAEALDECPTGNGMIELAHRSLQCVLVCSKVMSRPEADPPVAVLSRMAPA